MLKIIVITLSFNIYCVKLAIKENIFSICNNFRNNTFSI